MKKLLSTKDIAQFLGVNEKMVYTLVSEKGLPATKITGKWAFPLHLVERWIEVNAINYPDPAAKLPPYHGLLIITGSNDPLLDRTISLYNTLYPDHIAVFGNMGSMGGLRALKQDLCHMASCHLLSDDDKDYNFAFAAKEFESMPAVVNFCYREQGLLLQKGNPKKIVSIKDLANKNIKIVNRPLGTGTRLLFDKAIASYGIKSEDMEGYNNESDRHLDAGIEVLAGRADAAPGIKAVAVLLDLDFIPIQKERFDLLISKDRFFDKGVQLFLSMFHDESFKRLQEEGSGYDFRSCGKIIYPDKM